MSKATWTLLHFVAAAATTAAACAPSGYRREPLNEPRLPVGVGNEMDDATQLRRFEIAIAEHPNDAEAFFERGNLWDRRLNADRAIADYTEAIRIEPRHSRAYFKRGWIKHNRRGDFEGALEDFNRAIGTDPTFADAHMWRGQTYRMLKIFDAAVVNFEAALSRGPSDRALCERWLLEAKLQGNPPALVSATAEGGDLQIVYLRFSQMVDSASATSRGRYTFSDEKVGVVDVSMGEDPRVVVLRISGLIQFGRTTVSVGPEIKGVCGKPALQGTRPITPANSYRLPPPR